MFSKGGGKRSSSTAHVPQTASGQPSDGTQAGTSAQASASAPQVTRFWKKATSLQDEPPAYTADVVPSLPTRQPIRPPTITGFPNIDYSRYFLAHAELSKDRVTLTTTAPALSSKPDVLLALLRAQAALPPIPLVCIRGTSSPPYAQQVVDFDLKLNLLPLIWRGEGAGAWNYLRLIADGERGFRGGETENVAPNLRDLPAWVRKFCHDQSVQKRSVWALSCVPLLLTLIAASCSSGGSLTGTPRSSRARSAIFSLRSGIAETSRSRSHCNSLGLSCSRQHRGSGRCSRSP